MLPLLLGRSDVAATSVSREAVVHQSATNDFAVRRGSWKLIVYKDGRREPYDLARDLSETNNVAAKNAAVVADQTGLVQRNFDEGRSTPGAPQKNDYVLSLESRDEASKKRPKK